MFFEINITSIFDFIIYNLQYENFLIVIQKQDG